MDSRAILLVEDDRSDEELTLRAFERHGVKTPVVVARDGAEALDYIFARGQHVGRDPRVLPRLILLDLQLPKVGGIEVLRQIRRDEITKFVPVVIFTSTHEDRDRLEAYALGANSYVRKPIEFPEFSEAIRQLGLYWLLLNRPPPASE